MRRCFQPPVLGDIDSVMGLSKALVHRLFDELEKPSSSEDFPALPALFGEVARSSAKDKENGH